MNALDGVIESLDASTFPLLEAEITPINQFSERVNNYIKNIKKAAEIYERTGVPPKWNFESWETFELLEDTHQRNSSKENIAPGENLPIGNKSKGSTRKNSVRQTTRNHLKKEKISIINEEQNVDNEKMPAPSQPAPRKTRQKKMGSQLQIKEEKVEEELAKQASNRSDSIIIEDVAVPVVDLIDSDSNEETSKIEANKAETEETPASRGAISKTRHRETTRKIQVKKEKMEAESKVFPQDTIMIQASLSESDFEEETAQKKMPSKRTKQSKIKKEKIETPKNTLQNATVVMVNLLDSNCKEKNSKEEKTMESSSTKTKQEEAKKRTRSHSSSDGNEDNIEKRPKSGSESHENGDPTIKINATFISKSPINKILNTVPTTMNTTIVVEKPKFVSSGNQLKFPATVDDLMTDDESDEDKRNVTKVVPKTLTKAVKQGADKKKVGEVEKMELEMDPHAVRVTRTKTRAQAKQQEEVDAAQVPNNCTPIPSKLIPKAASTVVKKTLHTPQSSSVSRLLSMKYGSELKASQAKDRELKQKLHEKKKEETQLEERVKKKEKLLKVQQQREAWEKETQRQKEELVKKKMLKIQAIEEKKNELKQKKKEEARVVPKQREPIYMITKPPLLPTDDCYDSDDERNREKPIKEIPWARSGPLREMQCCMMAAGDTVKNSFFSRHTETPDLQEIFVIIKPEKLRRTSSAIWHKAPRYTMMPTLDQHFEDSEDDD